MARERRPAEPATLRCFVGAFLIPADARRLRRAVTTALGGAAAGRLLPEANYHVTLEFIGDMTRCQLAEARDRVAALAAHPVTAQLPAIVGFPHAGAARILAAEVAEEGHLRRWHAALEQAFGRDGRPFRPHVTVLRRQQPAPFDPVALEPPLAVTLAEPALYRSDRDHHGARYRPVTEADCQVLS